MAKKGSPGSSFVTVTGKARRSQAVSSFGIGTVTDFPQGSFMPLGLDEQDWLWNSLPNEVKEGMTIHEPRLQKLLGVPLFLTSPIPTAREIGDFGAKVKKYWGVPSTRFPTWLECPSCHRIGKVDRPFEMTPEFKVQCVKCGVRVNPVRFITACKKGHIGEFPWKFWAHSKSKIECAKPILNLKSRGKSAALADLYVSCETCKSSRSLHDIFSPTALKMLTCGGNKPWLKTSETCTESPPTVLQRGGSNVHFPIIASMLSIPPASEALSKILEQYLKVVETISDPGTLEIVVKGLIENKHPKINPKAAVSWINRRLNISNQSDGSDERSARFQEYEALGSDCPPQFEGHLGPEFENQTSAPPAKLQDWFNLIGAVRRLREVRAYCGFTRINPWPTTIEKINEARANGVIAPLSLKSVNWLPAVEMRGEGIFFRLREDRVAAWSDLLQVKKRAEKINMINEQFFAGRGIEPPHKITPRLLLTHSLSHVLIRRLSLDCGYSSASLRERLYISEPDKLGAPMAGILIYTASPDSDGSLGGLVNMTEPSRIESLIRAAVQDAFWCGNDPVCMETNPDLMGERASGASCHNCLLLPENACEKFNRELDRVMLAGSDQDRLEGFFTHFPMD